MSMLKAENLQCGRAHYCVKEDTANWSNLYQLKGLLKTLYSLEYDVVVIKVFIGCW